VTPDRILCQVRSGDAQRASDPPGFGPTPPGGTWALGETQLAPLRTRAELRRSREARNRVRSARRHAYTYVLFVKLDNYPKIRMCIFAAPIGALQHENPEQRAVLGRSMTVHHPMPSERPVAGTTGPGPHSARVVIMAEIEAADVATVVQTLKATLPPGARLRTRLTPASEDLTVSRPAFTLTVRQWEIFALLSDALTNKQIGRRLGLSHFTVRNHVCQILHAVGARSRRQAEVLFAELAAARSGRDEVSR
jgi:DNA-binding CsgD family transcriptional regulator